VKTWSQKRAAWTCASIFIGGKDSDVRVPVVRAVRMEVFLQTTRHQRKWTGLDVLKKNSWEGQHKALLFVVPDVVILCGASFLQDLNVLAPQDDMGRPIGERNSFGPNRDLSDWNGGAFRLVPNRVSH